MHLYICHVFIVVHYCLYHILSLTIMPFPVLSSVLKDGLRCYTVVIAGKLRLRAAHVARTALCDVAINLSPRVKARCVWCRPEARVLRSSTSPPLHRVAL